MHRSPRWGISLSTAQPQPNYHDERIIATRQMRSLQDRLLEQDYPRRPKIETTKEQ